MGKWKIDYGRRIAYFSSDISLDEMAKCIVNWIPEDEEFQILIYGTDERTINEGNIQVSPTSG